MKYGLRIKKVVNGVTTDYTLNGKNVVHMTQGGHDLHFFYDAQGKPGMVTYNDVDYFYVYNLQGDVVALIDANGTQVVEYVYDAWGNPISKTGSLAATIGTLNPFRYRGYVYDEETGLYYLRSRYYNPVWKKFVNADQILKIQNLLDNNMFCYCKNVPVLFTDSMGQAPTTDAFLIYQQWAQLDGPYLGGDVIGLLLGTAYALYSVISNAKSKAKSQAITLADKEEKSTFIYRSASGTYQSLTPRPKDTNGLSFSTVPPATGKYVTTTIEAINSTGILNAVKDSATHVSVYPVDMTTLQGWIDSRETANEKPHPYTVLLKGLVW